MRQKQSGAVTFVLYLMVAISLFLTWRILIVPSNNVSTQPVNSSTTTTSTLSNTVSMEDIFAPYQMSVHSNSDTYFTQDTTVMKQVNRFLTGWRMSDVTLEEVASETAYNDFILKSGRIELRFPTSIFLGIVSHYFDGLPEDLYNTEISRIMISTDSSEPIYLMDDESRSIYSAQRSEGSIQPLIQIYTDNQALFYPTDAYTFSEGVTFLPKEELNLTSLVYLVEKQPNSFFINQLFDDTTELRDDSNEFMTAYSDNISELRIHKETGILYYYRNNLDQTVISPYQQVRDSFHALKFIDTWTQTSYYSSYDEATREIAYRRYVNGIPIFSLEERGMIRMEMSNTRPVHIQYPTEVIQTPLKDREEAVSVMSAQEAIQLLFNTGYTFSDIQRMTLGYEWENSEESSRIITLTPKWYVKMNGSWQTVESWLTALEEEQHGL